jgi:hypothetical protein
VNVSPNKGSSHREENDKHTGQTQWSETNTDSKRILRPKTVRKGFDIKERTKNGNPMISWKDGK